MKKYLVIGNPIEHSLSPKLHNYWIKKNNLNAIYEKKQITENDIEKTILNVKNEKINGINVTVPFKKAVIPFLDELTDLAKETESVNTIYKKNNKVIGHNTDAEGFELAINHINYDVKNKKIFILGAGGVCPSIISALKRMKASDITISNRTKSKAQDLKEKYLELKITNWNEIPEFNMIINATSLGLKKNDKIKLNYSHIGSNKLFYDVIYNPSKTNFLLKAEKFGNKIENGKMMFIYQAQLSFKTWHGVLPQIDRETLDILND